MITVVKKQYKYDYTITMHLWTTFSLMILKWKIPLSPENIWMLLWQSHLNIFILIYYSRNWQSDTMSLFLKYLIYFDKFRSLMNRISFFFSIYWFQRHNYSTDISKKPVIESEAYLRIFFALLTLRDSIWKLALQNNL